jgi:hypothetical protein
MFENSSYLYSNYFIKLFIRYFINENCLLVSEEECINMNEYHLIQAAKKYIAKRTNNPIATVTNMLGVAETSSFCHYSIIESESILPILNFGITFSLALTEWVACSKARVACFPALLRRTIGPPGC